MRTCALALAIGLAFATPVTVPDLPARRRDADAVKRAGLVALWVLLRYRFTE